MRRLFSLLVPSVFFFLTACGSSALMELRHENVATEERIGKKVQELEYLQNQQKLLLEKQKNLLSDLKTQQITLNELEAELENLREANARIKVESGGQRKKKEDLELQLRRYQEEIDALRSNDRLSDEEKRKRIKDLEEQIRTDLEFMLTQ